MFLVASFSRYNELDASVYGVFWEFIRYYNCEWHTMYLAKRIGQRIGGDIDARIHYMSFAMRSFFDREQKAANIERLLDALNVVDSERNRNILHSKSANSVNISTERQRLFRNLMKRTDAGNRGQLQHVTQGTYNKTVLKEKLFAAHSNACGVLKQLTVLMEMSWDVGHC